VQASVNENLIVAEEVVGRTLKRLGIELKPPRLPGCATECVAFAYVGGPTADDLGWSLGRLGGGASRTL
jgi:hypothetical protein